MKKIVCNLFFCFMLGTYLFAGTSPIKIGYNKPVSYSIDEIKDKIRGGWAGQIIGCAYGGPTEFKFRSTINHDEKLFWDDNVVKKYFDNEPGLYDDIYMDLTFIEVMERCGIHAHVDSFALSFANADYMLWHANQAGRYNVLNGISAPASGHWLNNPHADDLDFQIESDFAGLMTPGMVNVGIGLSDKIGHIMTYGDGWYGGVFIASMYSLAYTSTDINYVVTEALKTIPPKSKFRLCIENVIQLHNKYPNDWKKAWTEIEKKHGNDVGCPDGALDPFNIDAVINSAYVVMGLLYGDGDFQKMMEVAIRCGQDSDCNPSTAAGIWGVMYGYSQIPDVWKPAYEKIEDLRFPYTKKSLKQFYKLNLQFVKELVVENKGKVTDDSIFVLLQKPKQVRWEQSFTGHFPVERRTVNKDILAQPMDIDFNGNGVAVLGWIKRLDETDKEPYTAVLEGWIDGKKVETFKMPANFIKRKYDIFYRYQLKNKEHKLTLKWINADDKHAIQVNYVVVYANKPLKSRSTK